MTTAIPGSTQATKINGNKLNIPIMLPQQHYRHARPSLDNERDSSEWFDTIMPSSNKNKTKNHEATPTPRTGDTSKGDRDRSGNQSSFYKILVQTPQHQQPATHRKETSSESAANIDTNESNSLRKNLSSNLVAFKRFQ